MTRKHLPALVAALIVFASPAALSQEADAWLPSLVTPTPQAGFELAVKLARKGVSTTQPDKQVLMTLRPAYSRDADSLTAASHVIAVHFQTIAAANGYWRGD